MWFVSCHTHRVEKMPEKVVTPQHKATRSILDERGIWVFEQSYMPLMLERNSYDTACHEHLEYYGLRQIDWMLSRCGLKIVDVEFNDVNGGSFSVTAAKADSPYAESPKAKDILAREVAEGLDGLEPYLAFAKRTEASRDELRARAEGRRVVFLGASTKGNVLLQYCGFTDKDVEAVGEVNPDKFGTFTPGMDRPACLLPVPVSLLAFAARLLGKKAVAQRLLGSLQVDISKTCELLDWRPPVSVDEGLRRAAQQRL
jgi:hypothetical protein